MTELNVLNDYRVSLLPPAHHFYNNTVLTISESRDAPGTYSIKDPFGEFITREGRLVQEYLVCSQEDYLLYRKYMCHMTKDEAFEAAENYLNKMFVNGWKLADILAAVDMSDEEFKEFSREVRKRNATPEGWKAQKETIVDEAEVSAWVENFKEHCPPF